MIISMYIGLLAIIMKSGGIFRGAGGQKLHRAGFGQIVEQFCGRK